MTNQLPAEWTTADLSELVAFNPKHPTAFSDNAFVTFVPMAAVKESSPKLDTSAIRPLGEVRKGYTHFADGDVLFAKITPCMENGKGGVASGLSNGIGCGSTELVAMRPSFALDPTYLYRFLAQPQVRRAAKENFTGTAGQARVPLSFLQQLEIPVPPLAEQRRIVAKLEEVLGKVERSQQRLAKVPVLLKRFRQSVLAAACSGRLTADWRDSNEAEQNAAPISEGKHQLPAINEDEILFALPETWQWLRLGTLARLINGDRGKAYPNRSEYVPSGIPFINTGHIEPDGSLSAETMHFLARDKFDSLRAGKIQKGDLVYCLRGATLGKTAFVEPYEEGAIASSLVIIRLNRGVDPRYIFFFLTSPYGKVLVDRFDNGSAQPNLSADSVKHYVIPLPPLAEQQEIVRRVEQLFTLADRIEARFQQAKAQIDQLTPALLAKAFRGQLVPQDPADEPASLLLERIRTAREHPVDHRPVAAGRPPLDPPRYFIQLIPALLRAVQRPLALDQLNAAVALLFLPDQLLPLVEATSGHGARVHFESFPQTNPPGAFLTAIQFLARAGTLKPVETDTGVMLRLNPAKAPPIASLIEEDARHLAAIIDLVPSAAVKSKLKELQPRQVREALLTM